MNIDFSVLNIPGWYEQHRQEQGDWDGEVLAIAPRMVEAIKAAEQVVPPATIENPPFILYEEDTPKGIVVAVSENAAEAEAAEQKLHSS